MNTQDDSAKSFQQTASLAPRETKKHDAELQHNNGRGHTHYNTFERITMSFSTCMSW